jgi:type IV pilus assembly protein PilW
MIAIVIGLVMLVALLTLFINTSRSNSEMAKMNSLIDNGRFAMQLLETDIAHAGFWGTHLPQFNDLTATTAPGDVPNAVPDPCLTYNATNWNDPYKVGLIGIPLQAYETVPTNCAGVITNRLANTDVLIVRHAESCVPSVGACEADATGKLYFQSSLQPAPPICAAESGYVLDTGGFGLHQRDCNTLADKRKFISHLYYIRDYAVTAGDGIPTLVRSEFDLAAGTLAHQAAVPLIEGIEGLRVEFGIDNLSKTGESVNYSVAIDWQDPSTKTTPRNRGDGIPDGLFVHCTSGTPCTAAQLSDVTAAKLYVLARARETTPGHRDTKTYRLGTATTATLCATTSTDSACTLKILDPGYKRHLFSTTVRLTNVSVRRETP